MRGSDERVGCLFSEVDLEQWVRPDHPLRVVREIANGALKTLSAGFGALYSPVGRGVDSAGAAGAGASAPGVLVDPLRAATGRAIEYDLLFRWFVGLGIDDACLGCHSFVKNRNRLLDGDVAARFLAAVLAHP